MADPVYVAHSEPAIWVCGGGRADVDERVPISDKQHRSALKLDGIRGGRVSYPGKPSVSAAHLGRRKPTWEAAIPPAGRGQGVADPRIVADDSGPMKPGNSVEGKTLTTEGPATGRNRKRSHGGPTRARSWKRWTQPRDPLPPPRRFPLQGKLGRPVNADGTWEAVDERCA